MAHDLVDVDTWTAAVTVPDDGDAFNAMAFEVGMQDLGDRTLYLRNRLVSAAGGVVNVSLVPIDYGTPAVWMIDPDGYPTPGPGPGFLGAVNSSVAALNALTVAIPPIYGCAFSAAGAVIHGDFWTTGGHGGVMPNNPPRLSVFKVPVATGIPALVATIVDPSAIGVYESVHPIALPFASQPFDGTADYFIKVFCEQGGSAVADHLVLISLNITVAPV